MNKPASFGRRGSAAPKHAAPVQALGGDLALTPEQRAYLFGAEAAPVEEAPAAKVHVRHAGFIACAATTALVAALTLLGKPHDTVAALPPQLEEQAKAVFQLAGSWFTPLALAWSIFVIASNLAANLWLTQKFCGWRNWSGFPAFSLIGAATSVAVAFATGVIGLGETEIGYAMEAVSGGGVAALYRLLAGRRSFL
ncbi:hypothetical protein [Rhodoblastus sp.]|jgi:hypothetical protein|uniref:hypothetical protein n=1 Tax=Rhodoblastus sp. TaxID=1962975 RepID=UPI0025FAD2E6|nr:hypothetical protein [Rhodoblastus sp.]